MERLLFQRTRLVPQNHSGIVLKLTKPVEPARLRDCASKHLVCLDFKEEKNRELIMQLIG